MYSIVRDRKKVWPYCTACGCRLEIVELLSDWFVLAHFWHPEVEKDARGHMCDLSLANWHVTDKEVAHIIGE